MKRRWRASWAVVAMFPPKPSGTAEGWEKSHGIQPPFIPGSMRLISSNASSPLSASHSRRPVGFETQDQRARAPARARGLAWTI
jgi:hypothetical protein